MAGVTLGTLWLNDAADLSDGIAFPLMSKLTVVTAQPGEVRTMANGRLRMVSRAGRSRTWQADLPNLDRTAVDWLEDHLGELVLVRDDRGRKMFGTYLTLPDDAHRYDAESDVQITLLEVTHSEAV